MVLLEQRFDLAVEIERDMLQRAKLGRRSICDIDSISKLQTRLLS
jgi:hypothetical protein